ncbi:hypothetical protein TNCV_3100821 [Trichonephila clavipes]|nr:hypothetical protein TNCV_3100821 [Trichonephila clavipes]
MSYDCVACKRSLESLFGLGALGKINFLRTILHRQSSGVSFPGGNWPSKLHAAIGIPPIWCRTKNRYQLPVGEAGDVPCGAA